jgi:hypothetical protein
MMNKNILNDYLKNNMVTTNPRFFCKIKSERWNLFSLLLIEFALLGCLICLLFILANDFKIILK